MAFFFHLNTDYIFLSIYEYTINNRNKSHSSQLTLIKIFTFIASFCGIGQLKVRLCMSRQVFLDSQLFSYEQILHVHVLQSKIIPSREWSFKMNRQFVSSCFHTLNILYLFFRTPPNGHIIQTRNNDRNVSLPSIKYMSLLICMGLGM